MRQRKFLLPTLLLGALVLFAGCAANGNPPEIDIRGSDTMVNLGGALAEAYMDKHDNLDLVVQGGGSGTGIAAVLNQNADLAQSSRAMSEEEWDQAKASGIDIEEIIIAYDAIVVSVHEGNPVESLSLSDLGAIYRGEITNWSEVGGNDAGIVLLSRDTTSGTFVFYREAVVREFGEKPDAEYADDALFQPSTQAIVDETRQNPNAIGYIGLGYLGDGIKPVRLITPDSDVPVSPVEDHPEGVAYPLARPLYFYVVGDPGEALRDYLNFVVSDEGQRVVRELNFLPIPK